MIGYFKRFSNAKAMSSKVNDNKLFKNYTKIWGKLVT